MTRLNPIPRPELPEREPVFEMIESAMGFLPTSMRVMAKWPQLFDAFSALSVTVMASGPLDPDLRHLVAHVASTTAGCQYCQAHTATHGIHSGVAAERFANVWEFESSDLFTDAERSLFRFAVGAAQQPSAVADADFQQLSQHWSDDEVLHALAIIGLFGYLNRFNGALRTTLELEPLETASTVLGTSGSGWSPGHHA